jgi:DNA-binding transcriptional ArsR family regulator
MHELERIEYALINNDLDPDLFERCAQDLLTETYQGLSPVPGGTDWGRDADVHDGSATPPRRLMVTKSRDYSEIRSNMVSGLESLKQHSVPFDRVVIANPGKLSERQRNKLGEEAAKHGARLEAVHDRGFFASRLRRDGEWRQRLLGLSGDSITVSRLPWRLAESPWSQLPLVGRDEVLGRLAGGQGDVILIGKPGVGKTRLLAEVHDVIFVDPDAAEDRLADDIRWIRPDVIVIDDVGQTAGLARFIQRLRRQEADWLRIRLVVVCWPDEIEAVRDLAPGADEMELDLLERSEIDTIVRAMGITGLLARQEILDQAEGRPGWAVALADLLLRSGWEDLVTGKALIGQVDGYLRRSQLSLSARDLLAVVAALRGVGERDLTRLAKTVEVSRPDAGRLLRAIARGGLLDVEQRRNWAGTDRRYSVRPPMLADAVATEHYMLGDVPLGNIDDLLNIWPERKVDVVVTVCTAARLGSDRARTMIDSLVGKIVKEDLKPDAVRLVYENYLLVDERCATKVVQWLTDEFARLDDDGKSNGYGLRPLVELAYLAAVRYLDRGAIRLILEMAIFDTRETNPTPEHPLRKLAELCTRVHPDIPATADHRALVGSVLTAFLPEQPSEAQWRVWTAAAQNVLTPHARGAFTAPEDVYRLSIIETVVAPDHATVIHEQLWPPIRDRLQASPLAVVVEFADLVHEWLRVGGGYDHPFGQDHPQEAIARADAVGRAMLDDLIKLSEGKPGLAARVASTALMFDIEPPPELTADVEQNPFFRDVDRVDDWQAEVDALRADIADSIAEWAVEPPDQVVQRLVDLRAELKTAGPSWPARVWMACQVLADRVENLEAWVEASLHHGLFPEAAPFLERLMSLQPPELPNLVEECLGDDSARGRVLAALLADSRDDDLLELAVSHLTPDDYGLLDSLILCRQLSREVQLKILSDAPEAARGAFAIALVGRTDDTKESISDDLRDSFLAAVQEIRPARRNRNADYQLTKLIRFLAKNYPDTLEDLVRRCLKEAEGGGLFKALGYDRWRALHVLPRANKTSLLRAFPAPEIRTFLLEHLVGPDAEWLEELLDNGVITPDEALGAGRFHGRVPIDRMAELLVPRGVDPSRIAHLALAGAWTGEKSARYERLVERFGGYAEAQSPSISAVGKVGVENFTRARDEAREHERRRRIRGDT